MTPMTFCLSESHHFNESAINLSGSKSGAGDLIRESIPAIAMSGWNAGHFHLVKVVESQTATH